jgi:hypothetical protein
MERKKRLPAFGEKSVDEFDEEASVIEFMSYRSTPPSTTKRGFPQEEAMPIFLSNADEDEIDRPSFGRGWNKRAISSRLVKISILAASAAAIIAAILSVENPMALFANAKASLVGTGGPSVAVQSPTISTRAAPEPVVAIRSASIDRAAPEIQPNVAARAVSPTARNSPSRDEIAAAFRTAHQGQPEVVPPPAAAVAPAAVAPVAVATAAPTADVDAAPPARRLDPDELAALLKRARGLIAIGDFAPARLLLKRAADAQEPSAALLLAQTYDPAVLGKQDLRSITPDPAKAREWYQKAARFGSLDAQQRLSQMQN